jgi:uncharacterized damage-inducible protein DinB
MNKETIDRYERGGEILRDAVAGLSRDQLLAHPVPGTWSIQEIVIHLMDSDLIAIDRMKRMIAMEDPQLIGYDEAAFSKKLAYDQQSAADAVTILDLSYRNFAKVLRTLPADAWSRRGNHNERGPVTLGDYLQSMNKHMDHHLAFVKEKRAMVERK